MMETDNLIDVKVKKKRAKKAVPWEPYKAATSPTFSGNQGNFDGSKQGFASEKLIPYKYCKEVPEKCKLGSVPAIEKEFDLKVGYRNQVDTPKVIRPQPPVQVSSIEQQKEIDLLRKELQIQRDINQELKTLLVSTLSDDVNCQITSLTEDKVRLAKNIDSYHFKAQSETEEMDNLKLENQLWRSKFLAMAIRADDLTYSLHQSLRLVKSAQSTLSDHFTSLPSLPESLKQKIFSIINIDIVQLYQKSPCESSPNHKRKCTSNLTISCCRRCYGREIKLL